ncbi:MAG: hypothetical protein ACPGYY_08595 [Bacteroidia bacterium]
MKLLKTLVALALMVSLKVDAQHVIRKHNGETLFGQILSLNEDSLTYSEPSVSESVRLERRAIQSIDYMGYDKVLLVQNYRLDKPYVMENLVLSDVIKFNNPYDMNGWSVLKLNVKVIQSDSGRVIFLGNVKQQFFLDTLPRKSVASLKISEETQKYWDIDSLAQDNPLSDFVIKGGEKESIEIVNITNNKVSYMDDKNNKTIVSLDSVDAIWFENGASLIPVKKKKESAVKLDLALGFRVGSNVSKASNLDYYRDFDILRISGLSISSTVKFKNKVSVNARISQLRGPQVGYIKGKRESFISHIYSQTTYDMNVVIYELGVGYNIKGFIANASINTTTSNSKYAWYESDGRSISSGGYWKGDEATFKSNPHLGYSINVGYERSFKKVRIFPTIGYTFFEIDFDRVVDRRSMANYGGARQNTAYGLGDLSYFLRVNAPHNEKWNLFDVQINLVIPIIK